MDSQGSRYSDPVIIEFLIDRILQVGRYLFRGKKPQNWAITIFLYELLMKTRTKPNEIGDFTVEFQNLIFHMEPSDITILPTVISGEYEKTEIEWIKQRIEYHHKRTVVFIDVGANVGIYSLIVAKLLKENDEVWSIEPDPRNLARLKKNLKANKIKEEIVSILEIGVGSENGQTSFHLSKFGGVSHIANSTSAGNYEIPIRSLDELFMEKLDLESQVIIKIDVEGFEDSVLRGGINIISEYKPDLMVEILPNGKNLSQEIINSLSSLYNTAHLHIGKKVVEISKSFEHSLMSNSKYGNLTLSVKKEKQIDM